MNDLYSYTIVVRPLYLVIRYKSKFDWIYERLAKKLLCIIGAWRPKTIEFIKCKAGKTEDILREIDRRGFTPAPAPYLLSLGVRSRETMKKYGFIVSLDHRSSLGGAKKSRQYVFLRYRKVVKLPRVTERFEYVDEFTLHIASDRLPWPAYWWFAVIRKKTKHP